MALYTTNEISDVRAYYTNNGGASLLVHNLHTHKSTTASVIHAQHCRQ